MKTSASKHKPDPRLLCPANHDQLVRLCIPKHPISTAVIVEILTRLAPGSRSDPPAGPVGPDPIRLSDKPHATVVAYPSAKIESIAPHGLVLKSRDIGPFAPLRFRLRLTPLSAEARGAARLARLGIECVRPIAHTLDEDQTLDKAQALDEARSRKQDKPRRVERLLLPYIQGPTLLRALRDNPDDHPALAQAAGAIAGALARARWFNRDAKPSNFIVEDPTRLIAIDTAAIRRILRPRAAIERMLASLMLEPAGVGIELPPAFLHAAAGAALRALTGADPDPGAIDALAQRVSARIRAHGDPTPRDNPLRDTPERN